MLKTAKKANAGQTDRQTDRRTDEVTYRVALHATKKKVEDAGDFGERTKRRAQPQGRAALDERKNIMRGWSKRRSMEGG